MAWVWPAISAATSLYGVVSGNKARKETNQQEIDLTNTAMTRRMADLKRAGVNPRLAYMGMGAAQTPNLEAPSFEALSDLGDSASSAYTQSFQRTMMKLQGDNLVEQNALLRAQTAANAAQAAKTKAETEQIIPTTAQQSASQSAYLDTQAQVLAQEFKTKIEETRLTAAQASKAELDLDQLRLLQPLLLRYQELINRAEELGIPEKEATAEFWKTLPEGKYSGIIKDVITLWRQR